MPALARDNDVKTLPYINFPNLGRQCAKFINNDIAVNLISDLIITAEKNTNNRYKLYKDIIDDIYFWSEKINNNSKSQRPENCISTDWKAYTIIDIGRKTDCILNDKRYIAMSKTTIPIAYAFFGGIFLASTAVFGTILFLHLFMSVVLMGFWYALMLFVGSFGLFVVDLVSINEWRKLARGIVQKKKG